MYKIKIISARCVFTALVCVGWAMFSSSCYPVVTILPTEDIVTRGSGTELSVRLVRTGKEQLVEDLVVAHNYIATAMVPQAHSPMAIQTNPMVDLNFLLNWMNKQPLGDNGENTWSFIVTELMASLNLGNVSRTRESFACPGTYTDDQVIEVFQNQINLPME